VEKPTKARDLNKNSFYIGSSNSDVTKRVPFKTSNQLVADLLSEKLGTKVTLIAHNFKREFIPFNEVPYDSLYVKMMKASDNFIAEQLLLQVGNKTVQQYNTPLAIKYVLDGSLAEIPDRPRWVDGSGLSRYNLFSPRSMVFILSKLYHEVPKDKLISYFPQVGMEGTLKNNFKEQPYVHAKSGTLSNNYSLSGYLTTKKGTVLIFSYMNNHYTGSSNKRKKEMAVFFKELYESF